MAVPSERRNKTKVKELNQIYYVRLFIHVHAESSARELIPGRLLFGCAKDRYRGNASERFWGVKQEVKARSIS